MVSAEDKDAGQERAGADDKQRVLELLLSQVHPLPLPTPRSRICRKRQTAATTPAVVSSPVGSWLQSIACELRRQTNQNAQPSSV